MQISPGFQDGDRVQHQGAEPGKTKTDKKTKQKTSAGLDSCRLKTQSKPNHTNKKKGNTKKKKLSRAGKEKMNRGIASCKLRVGPHVHADPPQSKELRNKVRKYKTDL